MGRISLEQVVIAVRQLADVARQAIISLPKTDVSRHVSKVANVTQAKIRKRFVSEEIEPPRSGIR